MNWVVRIADDAKLFIDGLPSKASALATIELFSFTIVNSASLMSHGLC